MKTLLIEPNKTINSLIWGYIHCNIGFYSAYTRSETLSKLHYPLLGYELLRVLLPPRGNFGDYVFHKAYHLTSFLKHVSPLAASAFWCYIVLITLPLI